MKKLVLFYMLFFCSISFAFPFPEVSILFNNSPPTTVFYGETLRIPVQMNYKNLRVHKQWTLPKGSTLENVSGICPVIPYDSSTYWSGTCHMNIVIPGKSFETPITGALKYNVYGEGGTTPDTETWNMWFLSPEFSVAVIPHNLSMSTIAIQESTANQDFVYNLKSAVKFFDENVMAGLPVQGIVNPVEQDGLRFDQESFSIVGTPQRTGTYIFQIGAKNANSTTASVDFKVQVRVNPKDKPVFIPNPSVISATPGEKYSINLMDLIEPQNGFNITNQISFQIDTRFSHPAWLHISNEDVTHLVGEVPKSAAGQDVSITLIARSNTGGNSIPLTLIIPVAYDPDQKPVIEPFELKKAVYSGFNVDLSRYINDPAHDASLKVIIDKVEPDAPWLHISFSTVLEGNIPFEVTGQLFQITLRANTATGGNSEPRTIPLQIVVNKQLKPIFKSGHPLIPMFYPGQPFVYDFVANKDIYPEYSDAPYEIKYAPGFNPPSWLRIEDNKLISDLIPADVRRDINIRIVISNIPGGSSGVYSLSLTRAF